MNNITSKTAAWSPADLRDYLSGIVSAYKEDEHWPHIFTILTNGLEIGDPLCRWGPQVTHPLDPEMIRRVQAMKELLMAVPRRHLPGGILGKTIIPVSVLWQIARVPSRRL
jgi:hypothetical protein